MARNEVNSLCLTPSIIYIFVIFINEWKTGKEDYLFIYLFILAIYFYQKISEERHSHHMARWRQQYNQMH